MVKQFIYILLLGVIISWSSNNVSKTAGLSIWFDESIDVLYSSLVFVKDRGRLLKPAVK